MSSYVPPADVTAAVRWLASDHHPYGDTSSLDRVVQGVFYHYGVAQEEVGRLIELGFVSSALFRQANPDGDEEERRLYYYYVELVL